MSTKIRFSCDSCGRALGVDAEKAGKKIRCPDCQTVATVPSESAPAARKSEGSSSAGPAKRPAAPSAEKKTAAKKPAGRSADAEAQPEHDSEPVQRPVRRRRRGGSDDPNDIWSQPLSSYSSPAIEEHEYEQFGIQPKRSKVEDQTDSNEMTLKGPMVFFAVGMLVSIAAVALAFAVPKAGQITGYVSIGLGGLLSLIGHWKIRETAFEESSTCGFMYVWMPFYQPYYILSRFAYIKIPFLVSILGNIVLFVGITGLVLANIQLEKAAGG